MTHFVKLEKPSLWRRLAKAGWGPPQDPSIHGFIDIDMTLALKFIEDARKASGEHITITHLVAKAIAMAIREYPLINGVIRWDGFWMRKTIDVFVLAARDHAAIQSGGGLSGVKIPQTDHMSVAEVARYLNQKVQQVVNHRDPVLDPTQKTLKWIPDWLLRTVLGGIDILSYELDLDMRGLGVPYDQFGSVVITNVGMLGLSNGFAPIFPPSRCPMVISVGEVRSEPMVVAGKVEARPRLVIGCTVDHRFIDGLGAAKMARRFRELLVDPYQSFGGELPKPRKKRVRGPSQEARKVAATKARAGKAKAPRASKKPARRSAKILKLNPGSGGTSAPSGDDAPARAG